MVQFKSLDTNLVSTSCMDPKKRRVNLLEQGPAKKQPLLLVGYQKDENLIHLKLFALC